ncbi:MAG: molybdopterin-dependent oxidoreductase, partial [Thermodesulfobacteriota bacterium]
LLIGTPLIPELIAQKLFATVSPDLFNFFFSIFGEYAKYSAFAGAIALHLGIGTMFGILFAFFWKTVKFKNLILFAILYSIFLWLIFSAVALPLLSFGFFGKHLAGEPVIGEIALLIFYLLYGLILYLFSLRLKSRVRKGGVNRNEIQDSEKRKFAEKLTLTFFALSFISLIFEKSTKILRAEASISESNIFSKIKGLPPEVTPNEDFYVVSKNIFDPTVSVKNWALRVEGLVEKPLKFSYEQLKKLPTVEQYTTLMCISNPVGGEFISNALWKGVALKTILEMAKPKNGAVDVVLYAFEDYSDSIPLEKALKEGTTLAYQINGKPLPDKHGFPIRLLVPGIYGEKNVKWITKIELVNYDYKGFWQRRGWSDTAVIKTMSRIDVPKNDSAIRKEDRYIGGIAFAGERGIKKVEVSLDEGKSWREAQLKKPFPEPYTWAFWAMEWEPTKEFPKGGDVNIIARAMDGEGNLQTYQIEPPAPDGSSGYHVIKVKLKV